MWRGLAIMPETPGNTRVLATTSTLALDTIRATGLEALAHPDTPECIRGAAELSIWAHGSSR
jgi:hypothetical protein